MKNVQSKLTPELIERGRLLNVQDVLALWPMSRNKLSILTNHPNPELRIPSYKIGGSRFYSYDEIMWYRDKQRYEPKQKRKEN